MEFIRPGTNVNFIGKRNYALIFSGFMILIGIVSLIISILLNLFAGDFPALNFLKGLFTGISLVINLGYLFKLRIKNNLMPPKTKKGSILDRQKKRLSRISRSAGSPQQKSLKNLGRS